MTQDDMPDAELAVEDRRCFTCDYWFVGRQILTTETRGWCLSIGSHYERSTADDGWDCDVWEPHV